MKIIVTCIVSALLWFAAGCASPESRVREHQAAFDSWPADVQEKVRAGKVDMGFTQEMVRVALGEPDRVMSRSTERGVAEGWVYMDKSPKVSFGIGVGKVSGSSAVGTSMVVGDDWRDEEVLRVMFEGGRVSAIETRK